MMKKEWFSTAELIGVGGLPTTIQGINQKAKREEWKSRKRVGVQGKALEYHIDSLPYYARNELLLNEKRGHYSLTEQDPLAVWVTAYHQLTPKERKRIIALIMQRGVKGLMERLPDEEEEHE